MFASGPHSLIRASALCNHACTYGQSRPFGGACSVRKEKIFQPSISDRRPGFSVSCFMVWMYLLAKPEKRFLNIRKTKTVQQLSRTPTVAMLLAVL